MNASRAKTKQYPGGILTGSAPLQKEAVFSAKVLPLVPSCADYSACVTFEKNPTPNYILYFANYKYKWGNFIAIYFSFLKSKS